MVKRTPNLKKCKKCHKYYKSSLNQRICLLKKSNIIQSRNAEVPLSLEKYEIQGEDAYISIYDESSEHSFRMRRLKKKLKMIKLKRIELLDQKYIEEYKKKAYDPIPFTISSKNLKPTNNECLICLGEIKENDECTYYPCFHLSHTECNKKYLISRKCPFCSYKLILPQDIKFSELLKKYAENIERIHKFELEEENYLEMNLNFIENESDLLDKIIELQTLKAEHLAEYGNNLLALRSAKYEFDSFPSIEILNSKLEEFQKITESYEHILNSYENHINNNS